MINNQAAGLKGQIEREIQQYLTEVVNVGEGHDFSQYKLVRRISLFENRIYPTGKFDSQGNYKYWFSIQDPCIDDEVKNIDFDTKDPYIYSDRTVGDELPCLICNLKLKEYLKDSGQAEEINSAVEEFSGWGNVVWKKVKGTYDRMDLRNFYVINQTAKSLKESPVIERHDFIASDLRAKAKVWENVSDVIEQCKSDTYKSEIGNMDKNTTVPHYEIFERNGEVCLSDLKEAHGEACSAEDEEKYVFAKVIAAGIKSSTTGVDIKFILFAEELKGKDNSDIYKEAHRGRYKGRWFREGLYELLFDLQVRANAVGNQIAQGLELASKNIYSTEDKLVVQNVMSDLKNGDIIKARNFAHVEVRMNAFDQLANEWNRIISLANRIAHSTEIVQGESQPNQPFKLGALLNQNANKIYDFLREKLSIPLTVIFQEWIIPDFIADLKMKDIIALTGDVDMLMRIQILIVEDWYKTNLWLLPPHTEDQAKMLKQAKLAELMARPKLMMAGFHALFEGFKPYAKVVISGENNTLDIDLQTLGTFAQLEQDPVRRSAIIELMMKRKGIDVGSLPKTPPAPVVSPMQPKEVAPAQ